MAEEEDLFDSATRTSVLGRDQIDVVTIDDLALEEEFIRFPGDLAYWNAQYTRANEAYLRAKHNFEIVRAQLWLETKEEESAAENKVTVDDLKCMVTLRDEWTDAHLVLIAAEAEKERLKKFAEAVAAKKDMLQSLGAKLRVEMEGDPTIREQQRESKLYRP